MSFYILADLLDPQMLYISGLPIQHPKLSGPTFWSASLEIF